MSEGLILIAPTGLAAKALQALGKPKLPAEAVGLRLARINAKGELILCEPVIFTAGRSGVDIVLRRAAISGHVEIGGEIKDHFADVLDGPNSWIETVALDAKSYGALKNKWMRCKVER